MSRLALFSDNVLASVELMDTLTQALSNCGIDFELCTETQIEPANQSFLATSKFAREGRLEG